MWISVTMTKAGEILSLRKLCDELAAVKGIDFNYFFLMPDHRIRFLFLPNVS